MDREKLAEQFLALAREIAGEGEQDEPRRKAQEDDGAADVSDALLSLAREIAGEDADEFKEASDNTEASEETVEASEEATEGPEGSVETRVGKELLKLARELAGEGEAQPRRRRRTVEASEEYYTLDAIEEICPPCAESIRQAKQLFAAGRTAAKGDKCGEEGCIRNVGGKWKVMSGKTGKFWPATYPTKESAEEALASWHASRFKGAK